MKRKFLNKNKRQEVKKMKLGFKIALMSLMTLLMAGIAYGALTYTFDKASTTAGAPLTYLRHVNSTHEANVSIIISGHTLGGQNITTGTLSTGATGCTITGALTSNVTPEGITDNTTYMNFTVNTLAMKDDTSCQFSVALKNGSNQQSITATRSGGLYISDNTKPVLTLSTPTDLSIDTDGIVTFNYACANTSSATLLLEGKPYTMTESSDVCTYTNPFTSKLTNGFHSWYISATDGLNITTSPTTKVEIRKPGSSGIAEGLTVETTPSGGVLSGGIGTLVVIGAAAWLIFSGKKKKG